MRQLSEALTILRGRTPEIASRLAFVLSAVAISSFEYTVIHPLAAMNM